MNRSLLYRSFLEKEWRKVRDKLLISAATAEQERAKKSSTENFLQTICQDSPAG